MGMGGECWGMIGVVRRERGGVFCWGLKAKGFLGDILCGCQVEGAIGPLYQGRAFQ